MIVGVDPGGRSTGVVLRDGQELLRACTVTRAEGQLMAPYIVEVNEAIEEYLAPGDIVAVEDVVAPRGFRDGKQQFANPASMITTAQVLGGVLAKYPDAAVIRPNKNGSGPLANYPEPLRPKRGNGKGHDNLRHMRSAWDVSLAAESMWLRLAR